MGDRLDPGMADVSCCWDGQQGSTRAGLPYTFLLMQPEGNKTGGKGGQPALLRWPLGEGVEGISVEGVLGFLLGRARRPGWAAGRRFRPERPSGTLQFVLERSRFLPGPVSGLGTSRS